MAHIPVTLQCHSEWFICLTNMYN